MELYALVQAKMERLGDATEGKGTIASSASSQKLAPAWLACLANSMPRQNSREDSDAGLHSAHSNAEPIAPVFAIHPFASPLCLSCEDGDEATFFMQAVGSLVFY